MDASERRRRAAEEAAEWWVRLQGDVPRAEREQYVDWLRESAIHVAEMLRVAQVHGALAQFERWQRLPTDGSDEPQGTVVPIASAGRPNPPTPRRHTTRRSVLVWATAASLVLACALAALYMFFAAPGQIIATPRGERREVALTDGSVVQVDPETRLRIDYQSQARRVYLERGRALFHVAKNPARPFLVQADGTTVRAVGTAFAVEHGSTAVVVTVAEGRVAVLSSTHETQAPPTVSAPRMSPPLPEIPEILVSANQQVTVERSGATEPVHAVDSARALAWAEGRLIFENEPVDQAVREFNRYNRIQIAVSDPALGQRPISGVFSAADPESFVAFIQSVAQVRIVRDESQDIAIEAAK